MAAPPMYYLVDFEEGPQVVPKRWLTDDETSCAWPPWADDLDQLAWDKAVRDPKIEPQEDWTECRVLRVRVKGSNFPYVRGKLKEAEDNSDTDLQSGRDSGKGGIRLRKRRTHPLESEGSDEDALTSKPQPIKCSIKRSKLTSNVKSTIQLPQFPQKTKDNESSSIPTSNSGNQAVGGQVRQCIKNEEFKSASGDHCSEEKDRLPLVTSYCKRSSVTINSVPDSHQTRKPSMLAQSDDSRHSFKSQQSLLQHIEFENLNDTTSLQGKPSTPFRANFTPLKCSSTERAAGYGSHEKHSSTKRQEDASQISNGPGAMLRLRKNLFESAFVEKPKECKEQPSTSGLNAKLQKELKSSPSKMPTARSKSALSEKNSPAKISKVLPSSCHRDSSANKLLMSQKQTPFTESSCNVPLLSAKSSSSLPSKNNKTSDEIRDRALNLAKNMSELEFKAYVISSLISLKTAVNNISSTHQRKGKGEPSTSSVLVGLPADSIEEWQAFDDRVLKGSQSFIDEVVAELRGVGGTDVGSVTWSLLTKLLSNRVADNFSFHGARGKVAFKETSFFEKKILYKVVRHHFKRATDAEIIKVIENWLRLAGQRKGGLNFKKQLDKSESSDSVPLRRSPRKSITSKQSDAVVLRRSPRKHATLKSPSSVSLPQKLSKGATGPKSTSTPRKMVKSDSLTPRKDTRLKKERKDVQRSKAGSDDEDFIMHSDMDQIMNFSRDEASGSESDLLSGYHIADDEDSN